MLGGWCFCYVWQNGYVFFVDVDFVIMGIICKGEKKLEGLFGDYLGYYSLEYDFLVMEVEKVYYCKDVVWYFIVVGWLLQEDLSFGYFIYQLVKLLMFQEFLGIKEINVVDVVGVYFLLLVIGSEWYMLFWECKLEEIFMQVNCIIGFGQIFLAKFLFIVVDGDVLNFSMYDIFVFFWYVLECIDLIWDLYFQIKMIIDMFDYFGSGWNVGFKVIVACCGDKCCELSVEFLVDFSLFSGFSNLKFVQLGILVVQGLVFNGEVFYEEVEILVYYFFFFDWLGILMIVFCDDSDFFSGLVNNFFWVVFIWANFFYDIYGVDVFVEYKYWGCWGFVIIDVWIKLYYVLFLIMDKEVEVKADCFFKKGGLLEKWGQYVIIFVLLFFLGLVNR